MSARKRADKIFLGLVIVFVCLGFFMLTSASLGKLVQSTADTTSIIAKQFFFGILAGGAALLITARIEYKIWRKYAFYLFIASLIAVLLVFIPHIGATYGGATRWINLRFTTFQPAELLKLGAVLYLAAIFASMGREITVFKRGPAVLLAVLAICGVLLAKQPDFGTLLVISVTAIAMFIAAGGRWKHLGAIFLILLVTAGIVVAVKPYVRARVMTFLHPTHDVTGASYQVQQSLIAIGSGELTGRGFGKSIQKYKYLPEPTGDSIFAVAGEEFGFMGALLLIGLFLALSLRGFMIARAASTPFGGLLVTGIVILVVSQSFINIGSMLGVMPLTGMPLLFVSQGGTALMFALLEMGIILNVSKSMRQSA